MALGWGGQVVLLDVPVARPAAEATAGTLCLPPAHLSSTIGVFSTGGFMLSVAKSGAVRMVHENWIEDNDVANGKTPARPPCRDA